MKSFKVICLSLMLFSLTLFAQESTEQSQESIEVTIERSSTKTITPNVPKEGIRTLITEIKTAKIKDRRRLMNQLKIQLREVNKESRQKAIMELKKSFASKGNGQHKHQHNKNLQEQQSKHQPKYRQLRNGQGQGSGRGNGNGQGNGHP